MDPVTLAAITTVAGIVIPPLTTSLRDKLSRRIGLHSNNIAKEIAERLGTDEDNLRKYLGDPDIQSQIQIFKTQSIESVNEELLHKKFRQYVSDVPLVEFQKRWNAIQGQHLSKLDDEQRDKIIFEKLEGLEDLLISHTSKISDTIEADGDKTRDKLDKLSNKVNDLGKKNLHSAPPNNIPSKIQEGNNKIHLRVIVGSPGDVKEERDMLDDVIGKINRQIANPHGLHLDLTKWETNGYPDFNPDGPPGILDPILNFPKCDIFIGIFWHKFGTVTKDGKTGTQHEFDEAVKEWQKNHKHHIMFYFNQKPYTLSSPDEAEQLAKVLQFKKSFPNEGLYSEYNGKDDFKDRIQDHLANLLNQKYVNKPNPEPENPKPSEKFTRSEKFEGEHDIFVGRKDKIDSLTNQMNDFFINGNHTCRTVTIWGMGGIGKSALAYHVMHKFEENHKIQTIPIYFESYPTLDDVLDTIAPYLSIRDASFAGRDKQNVLLSHMKDKEILLYADGFETISDAEPDYKDTSAQIMKFLNMLPSHTMILATSRNNKNFLNEKRIPLEELSDEDAIELFARLASADSESERDNIKKITDHIDNYPLSIEIIAHSYEGQGLANLLSDIQKYGITASKPDATSKERQHTIDSCIKFSFDKIEPRLQTLLNNLAQLSSSFSSEMVQYVFDAKSSDLSYLYNRTMITHIEKSSHGELNSENMLYDFHKTVGEFLQKHNAKIDYSNISQYYLRFLEEIYDSLQHGYTSQHLIQLMVLLESEENDLIITALDEDKKIQENISSCFSYVGLILNSLGNYTKSLFYHNKALAIHTELNDTVGLAYDYNNIGLVLKNMDKKEDARDLFNRGLKVLKELERTTGYRHPFYNKLTNNLNNL